MGIALQPVPRLVHRGIVNRGKKCALEFSVESRSLDMSKDYGVLTFDMQVCCGRVTKKLATKLVNDKVADWVTNRNAIRLREGQRHPDHIYPDRGVSAKPGPILMERYVNGKLNGDDDLAFAAIEGIDAGEDVTGKPLPAVRGWSQ
jgi:hypothetical protein